MRAQVGEQCVIKANDQFWDQMLAMKLEPLSSPQEFRADGGYLVGSVDLAGAWTGRIEVRLAGSLAREATAAMMMQPLDSLAEAEMVDATREIANIIGGVIKSSLPRPCTMTVPVAAAVAMDFASMAQGESEDSIEIVFRHASGDLMVSVREFECIDQPEPALIDGCAVLAA
jgi:CheY-specific phosphatase CheX